MEITFLRVGFLATLFMLSACDAPAPPAKADTAATVLEGKTMGTFWRVSVIDLSAARAEELRGKIQSQLDGDAS